MTFVPEGRPRIREPRLPQDDPDAADAPVRAAARPFVRGLAGLSDRVLALSRRTQEAPAWQRYAIGLAFFVVALAGRLWLGSFLPLRSFPFLTFFPAVLLTAFLAGLGPGLATAALSVVAATAYFVAPDRPFAVLAPRDLVALAFFAAILLVDVIVVHAMNRALFRVRQVERIVRGTLDELQGSQAEAVGAAARAEAERQVLDATLDAVPAGIIVADASGKVLRMNRANEQIWGLAPGDVADPSADWKGWWADDSPRHGQRIAAHEWGLARALRGERCTDRIEIEPFDRPGERRLLLMSAAPVLDARGHVAGAVAAQLDITARAAAESALRVSEAKFRTLAENIPQLAWMSDAHGAIHWFNQRWFEYTGATPEEMANGGWRQVHHRDHVGRVTRKFMTHTASGEPWEDTFPLRRHDGQYRWFLSRAQPVRDERGRITHWFGTNTDINTQLETERALRDSEERLLAREAALRDADRQKDTFIATLAHELRNPLAPIRASAQVIRLRDVPDDTVRDAIAVIERQSTHLTRLVDDLLDVSRITFGNLSLKRERVDLRHVLDSAIETCRPLIRSSGHRFTTEIPDRELLVDVDETRIAQCIANLVNNACKFTPAPGLVSLVVAARDDDWVSVKVRDNGQGISRAMLGKVFELFVQERLSGMGGNTGLGIGLALTRQLIEMHGGKVAVRSDGGGKGAEFEVLLPAVPAHAAPVAAEPPPTSPQATTQRILLVDDNADALGSLQLVLELQGHTVFTATDGQSALAAVQQHRPAVVVLDIGLPDIDGYEVARRIRSDAALALQPRLIALTGWGQQDDRIRAVQAGFDHHLTKPADLDVLDTLLRRAASSDAGAVATT